MSEREPTGYVPKYPMIPEEFGDYDRLDFGKPGGMGVVYKVLNRKLNVERALKVLRKDAADRVLVRDAFIREANFGAQLASGPFILPVHAVGTLLGWDFIEMDWVEGPNLSDFLHERGKLDSWVALTLGAMVLDALNFAHHAKIRYPDGSTKEGIIHRDIKPANILIDTRSSRPLLTDFGIALAREAAKDRQGGYTAGTINYLPPELIQDRPVDERSDIYQVGLVLYELLTGKKAFPGGAGEGVSGNIVAGYRKRSIRIERHEKKLDTDIIRIIEQALELEPDDRVQSAGTMRDEIRDYLRRRYVDHDPQQAFRQYLIDGKVPGRRLIESKVVKGAKKQAPKVLWSLLVLAILVGGFLLGRKLLTDHWKKQYETSADTYGVERVTWDKQEWSADRVQAADDARQSFERKAAEGDYRAARDMAKAQATQLREDVEPLRSEALAAQSQYDEEHRVFLAQRPPQELLDKLSEADAAIQNEVGSENYARIRDICRSQYQFLAFHDSLKAVEFRSAVERKEADRKYYEERFSGKPCGDSAAALTVTLTAIRDRHEADRLYQDGIEALDLLKVPGAGWSCRTPIPADTSCVAVARANLEDARASLAAFKSRAGWEEHRQSREFRNCSIKAVEDYLNQADRLLRVYECDGVLTRTDSAVKALKQLSAEWSPGPPDGSDTPDTTAVVTDPDSAYAWGLQAYKDRKWTIACTYLEQVPQDHEMYREACLTRANARCAQPGMRSCDEISLDLYRQAGPLVYRNKGLSFTNMLQCFYKLRMCDSVDAYFDKAIGTGEMSGNIDDVRYANSLYCKILCDHERYKSARGRNDDDGRITFGRSVVMRANEFFKYFSGSKWRSQADEIRLKLDDVRGD